MGGYAHLNNMAIVPIRLATLVFAHAIEMSNINEIGFLQLKEDKFSCPSFPCVKRE